MSTPLLSDAELTEALAGLTGWTRSGDTITRTVQAPAFLTGIEFVRQVAEIAETMNHHPDIDIRWRKVTLALTTHDAGGLTQKDFDLAAQIDEILG